MNTYVSWFLDIWNPCLHIVYFSYCIYIYIYWQEIFDVNTKIYHNLILSLNTSFMFSLSISSIPSTVMVPVTNLSLPPDPAPIPDAAVQIYIGVKH